MADEEQEQGLLGAPSTASHTQTSNTSYTSSASRAAHTSLNTESAHTFESFENNQSSSGFSSGFQNNQSSSGFQNNQSSSEFSSGFQGSQNFVSLQDEDTFQGSSESNAAPSSQNIVSLQDSSTYQSPVIVESSSNVQESSNVQSSSNVEESSNAQESTSQNANASYTSHTAQTSQQDGYGENVSVARDDRGEEEALLGGGSSGGGGGQPPKTTASRVKNFLADRWKEVGLAAWAVGATAAVITLAVLLQQAQQARCDNGDDNNDDNKGNHTHHGHHHHHHHHKHNHTHHGNNSDPDNGMPSGKRNLIFMVSDGMGPSSLTLTRDYRQHVNGLPWNDTLVLDEYLLGQSRTRSTDSWVTDSAAGATAFSCGIKTYNGAISMLPNFEPCGSVMEAAKRAGYTTGLVVTSSVTDATPATFVTHVRRREFEDEIALQMIGATHPLGRMVDLVFGGGRCHFLPNGTFEGCRADDENVVLEAKAQGWGYISSREEFDALDEKEVELPLLGLFSYDDSPYEIDRRHQADVYPSLEETTKTALRILDEATKDSEQGFFIMIEGSLIDHTGHGNDPAAQVHEVLMYNRAVAAVMDFINNSSTPTLMISTSDHETGGLAVARQVQPQYPEYLWYPEVLGNVSRSASFASREYRTFLSQVGSGAPATEKTHTGVKEYLEWLVGEALGIEDPTSHEIKTLVANPLHSSHLFADMVSRRAQIGWSTAGHTAADVNIYTSDPEVAAALRGNHENTEIGAFLREYLDLEDEVEEVTKLLVEHWHRNEGGEEGKDVGSERPLMKGVKFHEGL